MRSACQSELLRRPCILARYIPYRFVDRSWRSRKSFLYASAKTATAACSRLFTVPKGIDRIYDKPRHESEQVPAVPADQRGEGLFISRKKLPKKLLIRAFQGFRLWSIHLFLTSIRA